jgi:hypothetical protein
VLPLQNSTDTLEALEHAFDDIKRKLFSELHEVVRKQVFPEGRASKQLSLPAASASTTSADESEGTDPLNHPGGANAANLKEKR